jgi:hypothetical protein
MAEQQRKARMNQIGGELRVKRCFHEEEKHGRSETRNGD